MPIIYGFSSKEPDIWRCDFLNFNPEEQCTEEVYMKEKATPNGWYENSMGEVFCSAHSIDREEEEYDFKITT